MTRSGKIMTNADLGNFYALRIPAHFRAGIRFAGERVMQVAQFYAQGVAFFKKALDLSQRLWYTSGNRIFVH